MFPVASNPDAISSDRDEWGSQRDQSDSLDVFSRDDVFPSDYGFLGDAPELGFTEKWRAKLNKPTLPEDLFPFFDLDLQG
jgi:hypothetical protein